MRRFWYWNQRTIKFPLLAIMLLVTIWNFPQSWITLTIQIRTVGLLLKAPMDITVWCKLAFLHYSMPWRQNTMFPSANWCLAYHFSLQTKWKILSNAIEVFLFGSKGYTSYFVLFFFFRCCLSNIFFFCNTYLLLSQPASQVATISLNWVQKVVWADNSSMHSDLKLLHQ